MNKILLSIIACNIVYGTPVKVDDDFYGRGNCTVIGQRRDYYELNCIFSKITIDLLYPKDYVRKQLGCD